MNNQHNGSRGSRLGPFDYRSAADRLINYAPYANATNNNNVDDGYDDDEEGNSHYQEEEEYDYGYENNLGDEEEEEEEPTELGNRLYTDTARQFLRARMMNANYRNA